MYSSPLLAWGNNLGCVQLLNLGGGFKYFLVSSLLFGEMIQFDEHIFQMGWFNHQLGMIFSKKCHIALL